MQADCFAEYMRCTGENTAGALVPDLVCTSTLITCVNAHLYGSLGEHLVDRPGEADVTGKAFLGQDSSSRSLNDMWQRFKRIPVAPAHWDRLRPPRRRSASRISSAIWIGLSKPFFKTCRSAIIRINTTQEESSADRRSSPPQRSSGNRMSFCRDGH